MKNNNLADLTHAELPALKSAIEKLIDIRNVPDSVIPLQNKAGFSDDLDLDGAEQQAKAYADARRTGKNPRSDFGATDDEKAISQQTRDWLLRQEKRGHGKRLK